MDAFMAEALAESRAGLEEGGLPIGAVLDKDSEIVGRGRTHKGRNRPVQRDSWHRRRQPPAEAHLRTATPLNRPTGTT